jgi:DNA-binding MarR family transcriptional regulator
MDTTYYSWEEIVAILTRRFADLQSLVWESEFSDLTLRQISFLEVIHQLDNPTPTDLAKELRLSKPTISVAIDKLVEAGYLRKAQSDADRRSFHVHLSERGQRVTQAHNEVHRALAQHLTSGLDESEVQQLVGLMNKVITNWRKHDA